MNSKMGKECIETLEPCLRPPAEDAVVPSGALHHPCEGQELGSGSGTPSMVQDPPAEDAMMHSGVSCRPREDPELVGSTLPTLLLTWELSEASVEHLTEPSRGQAQDSCQIPSTIHWRNILTFAPSLSPQGRYQLTSSLIYHGRIFVTNLGA
ncbi:hypothetical protein BS47DRAFT_1362851 [Hydnum rufescens UP504]|uniref:Uncharacterized protein n=1 Tax=Hydnum rufescens UP504 TaxID=1448309 RepID=A0A9P6DS80_9AGAM|nr:hypothetical protein BS47DRAFT_1362851 [Hydnum rufescens UP504]